jgi:UDP-arabinose 4-epimerase
MKPYVLVTGGAGYIGSHMCLTLFENNQIPVVIDNLRTGHTQAVQWGPLYTNDIAETDAVVAIIRKYKIKTVYHFAAASLVSESQEKPSLYYDLNVGKTLQFLQTCVTEGISQFIFSSTCAVYGPCETPLTLNQPIAPCSIYGKTKAMIEQALLDVSSLQGLQIAILRYFNAAGADFQSRIGEMHDPETHLIPTVLQAGIHRRPFRIFGTCYPTPDGTAVRDYIHVLDLTRAHLLAAQNLQKAPLVANLGTGRGYSVLEVVQAAQRLFTRPFEIEFCPSRAGDPALLVANTTLPVSHPLAAFKPRVSDLDALLSSALNWHKTPKRPQILAQNPVAQTL